MGSIRKVGPRDVGVKIFLGRPIRPQVESGPTLVLWPLFDLVMFTKNIIQVELGSPSIDKKDNPINLPPVEDEGITIIRELEPFRITFGLPGNKKQDDPLSERLTTDPQMVVQVRIDDAVTFVQTIGNVRSLERFIANVAKSELLTQAGQMTPSDAIERKADVSKKIADEVEKAIAEKTKSSDPNRPSWGVNFLSLLIKSFGFSYTVNKAIADNVAAGYEKKKTVVLAEGEEKKRTLEGSGTASAREAFLKAEAAGVNAIAEIAKTKEGQFVLRVQAGREAIEKSKHTLILPSDSPLISTILVAEKAFEASKDTPEEK